MPLYGLLSPLDSSTPTIKIEKKNFTVGKDRSCDVVLKAPGIQTVHSQFTVNHNNELFVKRCSAQSRVSVAGHEVTCASRIKLGDEVQLGDANFIFDKAPVQETPLRSNNATSAPLSFPKNVKTKLLSFEPEKERTVGQELRCDDKVELMARLPSTDASRGRDAFLSETQETESSSQLHSYEMTPVFVTPREHGGSAYSASTAGAIFETPCFQDISEEATSVNNTFSDGENGSATKRTETLVSYPSTVVSPSSTIGSTEVSNSFDTGNHCERMSSSEIAQSEGTVATVDVSYCFIANPGVSPGVAVSFPVVLSEFARLSLTKVDASIANERESWAIKETVCISDKQFSSATVRLAKPVAHTETEGRVDSVVPSTSSGQRKKNVGTNKQRRGKALSTETPTSQRRDNSPIASRTRSHTTLQPEIGTSVTENPMLKRGGRSVERRKVETTARGSRSIPKRQKANSTLKARNRHFGTSVEKVCTLSDAAL
ncbi:hypothetical protein M513_06310 [Trichuris suis]|uniref:FHA domain-containing protein n=1 Tax=Trichuris suis TaxID=68888 RepID=A0A085M6H3_9BILA|nr:hypothetical protein M513_06310 [Trichuris suis]